MTIGAPVVRSIDCGGNGSSLFLLGSTFLLHTFSDRPDEEVCHRQQYHQVKPKLGLRYPKNTISVANAKDYARDEQHQRQPNLGDYHLHSSIVMDRSGFFRTIRQQTHLVMYPKIDRY